MTTFGQDGTVVPPADAPTTPVTDEVFNDPAPEPVPVPTPPAEPEVLAEVPAELVDDPGPAPSVEVATRDAAGPVAVAEQVWGYDFLEFEGDKLEIRLPTEQALTAFSLACGKYVPMEVQNDMVSLFISKHLSDVSYGHVMAKMMDPDDATYDVGSVGQLMGAIVSAAVESRKELKAAKAEADKALNAKK